MPRRLAFLEEQPKMIESSFETVPDTRIDIRGRRLEKAWPAYLANDVPGLRVPVPFSPTLNFPPAGYRGDYCTDAFTDRVIRDAWRGLDKNDDVTRDDALAYASQFGERNVFRATGAVDPAGKIEAGFEGDLRRIRRPAYFGALPYREKIAGLDASTTVVEVSVPADRHHRRFFKEVGETLHLRGWYIRGEGVVMEDGERRAALAIMLGGRGTELTAISHPNDAPYRMVGNARLFEPATYPSARTENCSSRTWRDYLSDVQSIGLSVLALDLRGHGASDGENASNAFEQGMDVFRMLDALETGQGLRIIGPDGVSKAGSAAAGTILSGAAARQIPVLLFGTSQGSMAASYAMHANFVSDFDFSTGMELGGPRGYNLKGAILEAEYAKGLGHWFRVHWDGKSSRTSPLAEAALREQYGIAFCPSSEILMGVSRWPSIFIGRGLWDSAGSLAGSLDLYRRAGGMKGIVVVRGPHSEAEFGPENRRYMRDRVLSFARALFAGQASYSPNKPTGLKDLVLSAPPYWDDFMKPG